VKGLNFDISDAIAVKFCIILNSTSKSSAIQGLYWLIENLFLTRNGVPPLWKLSSLPPSSHCSVLFGKEKYSVPRLRFCSLPFATISANWLWLVRKIHASILNLYGMCLLQSAMHYRCDTEWQISLFESVYWYLQMRDAEEWGLRIIDCLELTGPWTKVNRTQ